MLSILIPTYDYTCYKLVLDLHQQAETLGIPYEIIVAEDGSKSPVNIIANHKIIDLPHCRHIQRRENVGRAAIRNFLMNEAKGDFLLLMDSDGKIISDDFLKKYIEAASTNDVVCGGFKCPDVCYDPFRQLRWKYEKEYEKKHGYVSPQFRSFCFLITRKVADAVRFDETYRLYGYEDVQYGNSLRAAGFAITPINNPLENRDIELSKDFLKKTEEALRSAKQHEAELADTLTFIKAYRRLNPVHPLLHIAFLATKALIKRNLLSPNPSLALFNIYKLGYYSQL